MLLYDPFISFSTQSPNLHFCYSNETSIVLSIKNEDFLCYLVSLLDLILLGHEDFEIESFVMNNKQYFIKEYGSIHLKEVFDMEGFSLDFVRYYNS